MVALPRHYAAYFNQSATPFLTEPIKDLLFYSEVHRYRWRNSWVLHNVSEVVGHDISPFAKAAMEKHRFGDNGWELRGLVLHRCLDAYLQGKPSVAEKRWDAWLDPLLNDPLFKGIETLATEYLLVDRYRPVAGSCDFVIRHKDDPTFVILGDLKTVSNRKAVSGRKPALAQLGAYARMWQQWNPRVRITECVTVVSGPERCKVRRHSPEDECIPAWEECWGKFDALQPAADF